LTNPKNRVFVEVHSKDLVILACTVLIQSQSVKDRRTDTHTPSHADYSQDALSRVKIPRSSTVLTTSFTQLSVRIICAISNISASSHIEKVFRFTPV